PVRRPDRLTGGFGDPMRGAAMAALAPDIGLLDTTRAERLDRGADPLAAGGDLDERRSRRSVEASRVERARDRLEVVDGVVQPLERAPLPHENGLGEASGKQCQYTERMFAIKPRRATAPASSAPPIGRRPRRVRRPRPSRPARPDRDARRASRARPRTEARRTARGRRRPSPAARPAAPRARTPAAPCDG